MPTIREPRRGQRPVYGGAQSAHRGDGNLGLWYDKFCDQWQIDSGHWSMQADGNGNPKLAWIKQAGDKSGERALLSEYTRRVIRLATARGGLVEVFVAESRFVTGLGRSHPVENGFAWHPTLGTPYLPGSSLKGLVRAWATEQGSEDRKIEVERLLGGCSAGRVLFLDAIPVEPVRLEADVMTPHYAGWTPKEPPGDWRSPIPIPFLTAAAGTVLLVAILPACADDASELESVRVWLRQAFEFAGAGAKTAVGYGRFRPDSARTAREVERVRAADHAAQEARDREKAMATPEGRWRQTVAGASEGDLLELVRRHLEADPLTDPVERAAFVQAVRETRYPALWRQGKKADPAVQTGERRLKQLARLLPPEPHGERQ
jgi:CRISPR-associated protein Cmr6